MGKDQSNCLSSALPPNIEIIFYQVNNCEPLSFSQAFGRAIFIDPCYLQIFLLLLKKILYDVAFAAASINKIIISPINKQNLYID